LTRRRSARMTCRRRRWCDIDERWRTHDRILLEVCDNQPGKVGRRRHSAGPGDERLFVTVNQRTNVRVKSQANKCLPRPSRHGTVSANTCSHDQKTSTGHARPDDTTSSSPRNGLAALPLRGRGGHDKPRDRSSS
jgi:hypothetical protein